MYAAAFFKSVCLVTFEVVVASMLQISIGQLPDREIDPLRRGLARGAQIVGQKGPVFRGDSGESYLPR